jgi:lipopolysaccharide export system protein LptA
MTLSRRVAFRLSITAAMLVLPSVLPVALLHAQPAQQQANKGPPNALQGFSQNRDQPVHIEAATLVVKDKEKMATFSGDVKVVQGDTTMKCKSLIVFYEGDAEGDKAGTAAKPPATKTMQAATPGPGGEQKIKRLEAHGNVVVIQKDQTATGELGIFDMKTNTVTMTNNVVMTQGQNVLRGGKLIVDLTTGVSRVETGNSGRVQGLFIPGGGGPAMPSGAMPGSAPAPAAPPKPMPVRPF